MSSYSWQGPPEACRETTVHLNNHSFPSNISCLLKVRLMVMNPAVCRGTVHIRTLDPKQPVIVDFTHILLHRQNRRSFLITPSMNGQPPKRTCPSSQGQCRSSCWKWLRRLCRSVRRSFQPSSRSGRISGRDRTMGFVKPELWAGTHDQESPLQLTHRFSSAVLWVAVEHWHVGDQESICVFQVNIVWTWNIHKNCALVLVVNSLLQISRELNTTDWHDVVESSSIGAQMLRQRRFQNFDHGWMDGWVGGWADGRMEGWADGRMGGWVDGWMGGWMDGWMDGIDR